MDLELDLVYSIPQFHSLPALSQAVSRVQSHPFLDVLNHPGVGLVRSDASGTSSAVLYSHTR